MGHRTLHTPLLLALSLLALSAFAPTASADIIFCAPGAGAGQCENPRGVAVDTSVAEPSSGHVYVADTANHRVDVFDEAGAFLFAFGWKVNATAPEEKLQTCTALSGCQAGSSGFGAGQLSGPSGIAVDSSSHAVYVAEASTSRVQKFDSEGHFLLMFGKGVNSGTSGKADLCTDAGAPTDVCGAASEGSGAGQFNEIKGIGVGPAGAVYVADSKGLGPCSGIIGSEFKKRVQKFNLSGEATKQISPAENPCGPIVAFAADSGGGFYFANGNSEVGGVHKYDESGNTVTGWGEGGKVDSSGNIGAIALDPAGDLFVADFFVSSGTQILEYDSSGAKSLVFFGNGTLETQPTALAFHHSATGDLYAAESFHGGIGEHPRVVQLSLPEPGPLIVPGSTKAFPLGNVRATLKVSFNPEGKASEAHFQYIAKAAYEANLAEAKEGFAGAAETPDSAPTAADFESHGAEATNTCAVPTDATCLKPETTYYFRPIAANADGAVTGEKAEFTTLPPVQISATWSTDVGADSARLHAEANPLAIHASARFEYVDDAHFKGEGGFAGPHTQTTPAIDFGAGEAPLARAAQLTGLQPGTTYHYRLVASDPFFPPVISEAHTFTTFALPTSGEEEACPANAAFRSGPSAALPDCRAYEMVSPLDKDNGDIRTLLDAFGYSTSLDQSSTDGSGFTYSSYRAFANPVSAPYTNQLLATRHERGQPDEGWASEALDPQGSGAEFLENPFKAFSPDLGSAWLTWRSLAGEPEPDPCAPTGYTNLYRRESSGGAFGALSCAPIEHVANFLEFQPEVQGFSADGARSVFRADEALTPEASAATTFVGSTRPIYQLYEATETGGLRLLSVLPTGKAAGKDSSAGTVGETNSESHWNFNRFGSLLNAVSTDGARVFWSTAASGALGPLYLRANADKGQSKVEAGKCTQPAKACTIAVSETVSKEPALFQAANPEGAKALFTISGGNLYEFDAEAEPPSSHLIAEGVLKNILGASSDLSRVYFASEEASASEQGEGAVKGKPNVYLAEGGTTRFIATLSSGENSDVVNPYGTPIEIGPIFRTARVSPDGQSLVFMSNSQPLAEQAAGYDNTDAVSGRHDAEVYVYDASASEGKGTLRCLSCNPSGARPLGRELEGGNNGKVGPWGAATIPRFETELYQPRYLSEDGKRVFFNSFDALVLGDTNGKEDAYEWEAAGEGGCSTESPSYVPGSEGCLSLISSGQSPDDSEFLDASASGSDAFFTTAESLLPQDYGLIDVYDAREGGGFPPPQATPPSCEGEACQSPPEAPNDPTPASSAFEGAGNVVEPEARPKCEKAKVRRAGKCVSRKAHKNSHRRSRKTHLRNPGTHR